MARAGLGLINALLGQQMRRALGLENHLDVKSAYRKVANDRKARAPNLDTLGEIEFRPEKCVRAPTAPGGWATARPALSGAKGRRRYSLPTALRWAMLFRPLGAL
jgi:hypothetical protein